jgi:hypothetical protein
MPDLDKRLLQTYLLDTASTRAELGLIRRKAKPSRFGYGKWLLVLGLCGAGGLLAWKFSRAVPSKSPEAAASSSGGVSIPTLQESLEKTRQLRSSWLHFDEVLVRDVLQRLQVSCQTPPGSPRSVVSPVFELGVAAVLEKAWDKNPESEPKVSLDIFGCSLGASLQLLSAQLGLVFQPTARGLELQENTGLKSLPAGAWKRRFHAAEVKPWLAQQERLCKLSFLRHLEQAQGCLLMACYEETRREAEVMTYLCPGNAVSELLMHFADYRKQDDLASQLPTVTAGTTTRPTELEPAIFTETEIRKAVPRKLPLPQVLAKHGLPEVDQQWSKDGTELTLTDNIRHVRIAEAVVQALQEACLPAMQVQAYRVDGSSPLITVHQAADGERRLLQAKVLGNALYPDVPIGGEVTCLCGTADPVVFHDIQQVGRQLTLHWTFPKTAAPTDPPLELQPLDKNTSPSNSSSLHLGEWLEIPLPNQAEGSWLVHFTPADEPK